LHGVLVVAAVVLVFTVLEMFVQSMRIAADERLAGDAPKVSTHVRTVRSYRG